MKQAKPRKYKPVVFSLRVRFPEATIIDVKDKPISELKQILEMLEKKL